MLTHFKYKCAMLQHARCFDSLPNALALVSYISLKHQKQAWLRQLQNTPPPPAKWAKTYVTLLPTHQSIPPCVFTLAPVLFLGVPSSREVGMDRMRRSLTHSHLHISDTWQALSSRSTVNTHTLISVHTHLNKSRGTPALSCSNITWQPGDTPWLGCIGLWGLGWDLWLGDKGEQAGKAPLPLRFVLKHVGIQVGGREGG